MKILAIDTSCDETSVAVTEKDRILSNVIPTQIDLHKKWGGVVPSIARRAHEEIIDKTVNEALKKARTKIKKIDAIAVTKGPGLAIALEVGIRKAKKLAQKHSKPLVAVNHIEGHLYSVITKNSKGKPDITYKFPLITLIISGGHTEIILMRDHGNYEIVGKTLDDAVGEAFDKVGRMLDLGYPAGHVIERLAKEGDENAFELPIAMKNSGSADMSYSGLKTAAMQLITKLKQEDKLNKKTISDFCASFQRAAFEQLIIKTKFILNKYKDLELEDIFIGGGVSANIYMRKLFRKNFAKPHRLHFPTQKKLCSDNAAMIGVAGYYNAIRDNYVNDIESLDRDPGWRVNFNDS